MPTQIMRRGSQLFVGIILSGLLAGCAAVKPYRTSLPDREKPPADCSPTLVGDSNSLGRVSADCEHFIEEVARNYRLFFVEFDDQGWPYSQSKNFGSAENQINAFFDAVRPLPPAHSDGAPWGDQDFNAHLSIVVFVHGWKHTAQSNDRDLKRFRLLLHSLGDFERMQGCERQVVGLYVGWRGAGTSFNGPQENLTFWSRKRAATEVAQGSFSEVIMRLKAVQQIHNEDAWRQYAKYLRQVSKTGGGHKSCGKRTRTTLVGHSFGGLILYHAMSESLIRDISEFDERIRAKPARADGDLPNDPTLTGEGDMVILINPAIESSKFDALFRASSALRPEEHHYPILVSITSADDSATRLLFPLGRSISTVTKRFPAGSSTERRAAKVAIGHNENYITHRLLMSNSPHLGIAVTPDEMCREWEASSDSRARYFIEIGRSPRITYTDGRGNMGAYPRQFCIDSRGSGETLVLALDERNQTNPNTPIWNIRTESPIVSGHSDYMNGKLLSFIRQLYIDSSDPLSPAMIRFLQSLPDVRE